MTDILARQRQLIGTTAQWAANDLIIGNGEIAIERTAAGSVRMKVGNGTATYSALPYTTSDSFGEGYSWQAPSRTHGTVYQAPEYPIMVSHVSICAANDGATEIYVGAANPPTLLIAHGSNGGNGALAYTVAAIVPPFHYYKINQANLSSHGWTELRKT